MDVVGAEEDHVGEQPKDTPREDGAHRRPLPFSRRLRVKPAYHAIHRQLSEAPRRPQPLRLERRLTPRPVA